MSFVNFTNLTIDYARIWPTRGSQLFEINLAYGVAVGLTALAGGVACILLLIGSCYLCCCRTCCRCCPKKCVDCCFNCKRRRGRKTDHPRLNSAFVVIGVFLFSVAVIGLFCSFYGLLQTMVQVKDVVILGADVARVASRLVIALQEVFNTFIMILPDVVDFMLGLLPYIEGIAEEVVTVLNMVTNQNYTLSTQSWPKGVALTGSSIDTVALRISGYLNDFLAILCIIPPIANGVNLAILSVIMVGEGLAISGSVICLIALIRSKQPLLISGLVVLFVGSAICMVCFAFSTPLSVWIDDLCYTASLAISVGKRLGGLLLCLAGRVMAEVATRLMSMTAFLYNERLLPVMGTGAPRMSLPANISANVTQELSNRVGLFFNNSIDPILDKLAMMNFTLGSRAQEALSFARLLLNAMRVVLEVLVQFGDCDSGMMLRLKQFVDTKLDNIAYCDRISWGISMALWGAFTAAIAVFFAAVLLVAGGPLMGVNSLPLRVGAMLVLNSIGFNLSLFVALLAWFSGTIIQQPFVAPISITVFVFMLGSTVLLSLPAHWMSSIRMVRVFWIVLAIFAFVETGLTAGLLGNVAADLARCWSYNSQTCSFACSVMNITLLSICLVVAALCLIAAVVQFAISIVGAVSPTVKIQFHPGKPDVDWELHAFKIQQQK